MNALEHLACLLNKGTLTVNPEEAAEVHFNWTEPRILFAQLKYFYFRKTCFASAPTEAMKRKWYKNSGKAQFFLCMFCSWRLIIVEQIHPILFIEKV